MDKSYDLVVVGAGPGGYVAAIQAAKLGLKVACVSRPSFLGGTCLNVGCIPSKTLLHATELLTAFNEAKAWGLEAKSSSLDWDILQKHKQAIIKKFSQGITALFKKNKVSLFTGSASFLSAHEIAVEHEGKKETLQAKNVLIATGSEPISLPFLPIDEKRIVSSTGALSLENPPKKMLIVGGGVIGLELGSVYLRLGSEVSCIEALPEICPALDGSIAKALREELTKQGMTFYLGAKVTDSQTAKWTTSLTVETKEGKELQVGGDVVLVSIGRRPYTEGLHLDKAGVTVDQKGFIPVNGQFQSTQQNIYAIGDVIDGPMLAHKASEEGVAVAEFLAGKAVKVPYIEIPNVVYTYPEVASVGFTEEELKAKGVAFLRGKFSFKANSRASCTGEEEGFVKVLADKNSGRILGIHIIGAKASEMIAAASIAMHYHATAKEIGSICFAHPTLSEAIKEACLDCYKQAIHS